MRSHLVAIHVAVLLFGLSGLYAKLLVMSPLAIVWWRCLFAAVALGVVVGVRVKLTRPTFAIAATGVVLAAHWVAFFHSIQISSVAIGLISFSIFPVVVTVIEPLLDNEPFHRPVLSTRLLRWAELRWSSRNLKSIALECAARYGAYSRAGFMQLS